MGKGCFIYICPPSDDQVSDGQHRIYVKDSSFKHDQNATVFPLHFFTTDDLLKVKAQIATHLENRMDLDEVIEGNLERLRSVISKSDSQAIAKVMRQTLERIDVVKSDLKRAETRLEILQDEMKKRMLDDGVSEMKFNGLVNVTYKDETVYSVGEDGWDKVYGGIIADTIDKQIDDDEVREQLAGGIPWEEYEEDVHEAMVGLIDQRITHLKHRAVIENESKDDLIDILSDIRDEYLQVKPLEFDKARLFASLAEALGETMRERLVNNEAFAVIQKRLTSTTLNDLVKQGYDLPEGIVSTNIRKIKIKRNK